MLANVPYINIISALCMCVYVVCLCMYVCICICSLISPGDRISVTCRFSRCKIFSLSDRFEMDWLSVDDGGCQHMVN